MEQVLNPGVQLVQYPGRRTYMYLPSHCSCYFGKS